MILFTLSYSPLEMITLRTIDSTAYESTDNELIMTTEVFREGHKV